jgi:hypothetical protein
LAFQRKKSKVVYNALDYKHFKDDKNGREEVRRRHGLKGFVFLTYGRPGVSKGIEYAVKSRRENKRKNSQIVEEQNNTSYGKSY